LVFARVLFGLQILFVCESWSALLNNFNVFILVFHVHELLWELNPNRAKSPSLEVARKTTKFFKKKHKRKGFGLVTKGAPFVVFSILFSYLLPPRPPLGFGCGVPFRVFLC
jgi:hypothetical protein